MFFLSTDNGSNWVKKSNGLTGRTVKSLTISGDNIFAGTDVGVFRAKLSDMISTDITENLDNTEKFLISPNPATDFIDISNIDNATYFFDNKVILEIYNTLGEIVISESFNKNSGNIRFNTGFLPAGLYFVKIGNFIKEYVKL